MNIIILYLIYLQDFFISYFRYIFINLFKTFYIKASTSASLFPCFFMFSKL